MAQDNVKKSTPPESLGQRIARLRYQGGWTQQSLAERLGISRVAVSHIEMDLSTPGERTIALLAGLFKLAPHQLVENTTYPAAKSERLPHVVCCYTELEMQLALLENDLCWLEKIAAPPNTESIKNSVRRTWQARLAGWENESIDQKELELLTAARQRLAGSGSGEV